MTTKKTNLNLVLLGSPGAGKGTQAKILKETFKLAHIASGDLFRDNLRNNTELGQIARGFMERGELVPDDVTVGMVRERIARPDTKNGFVLDGFPRTLPQAIALDEILQISKRQINGVLYIKVVDDEIIQRLSGRMICLNCQTPYHMMFNPPKTPGVCDVCNGELYQRDDDKPETVKARLITYHTQTAPLVQYYTQRGILHEIDGVGVVSEVTKRLVKATKEITG